MRKGVGLAILSLSFILVLSFSFVSAQADGLKIDTNTPFLKIDTNTPSQQFTFQGQFQENSYIVEFKGFTPFDPYFPEQVIADKNIFFMLSVLNLKTNISEEGTLSNTSQILLNNLLISVKNLFVSPSYFSMDIYISRGLSKDDAYCVEQGYECGIWSTLDYIDCGGCTDGSCVGGKCYDFNELGECIPLYTDPECSNLEGDECFRSSGCTFKNDFLYASTMYWQSDKWIRESGGPLQNDLVIFLDEEDFSNNELEIPLTMVFRSPFLQEGDLLSFEIYGRFGNGSYTVGSSTFGGSTRIREAETITGVVDENGVASANFTFTGNDLYDLDFSISATFIFEVADENGQRPYSGGGGSFSWAPSFERKGIQPYQGRLILKKKTGECSGAIPCNTFNEWECQEVVEENGADCIWEDATNSCTGQEGVSCDNIGGKEICNLYGCSWRADSVWERFTDFFRNLFG